MSAEPEWDVPGPSKSQKKTDRFKNLCSSMSPFLVRAIMLLMFDIDTENRLNYRDINILSMCFDSLMS